MCGRFAAYSDFNGKKLREYFRYLIPENTVINPNYNTSPQQKVAVIVDSDGQCVLKKMRWGLIPSWAKDKKVGVKMINARSETVQEKSAFRAAFKKRRCIVPADGFYEWKKTESGKRPFFIFRKNHKPIAFAGLFESFQTPEDQERIFTFCILTTQANSLVALVHDRMPVILDEHLFETWLSPKIDDAEIINPFLTLTIPPKEITATSVVPPPMSTIILPLTLRPIQRSPTL